MVPQGAIRPAPIRTALGTLPPYMYFSGDGHNHWHVRDLELGPFKRLPDQAKLRSAAKHGFSFYDNYRNGSTASAQYTSTNSCVGGSSALQVTMGLSTGWGDAYWWKRRGASFDAAEPRLRGLPRSWTHPAVWEPGGMTASRLGRSLASTRDPRARRSQDRAKPPAVAPPVR